jgi:hypothetical protein
MIEMFYFAPDSRAMSRAASDGLDCAGRLVAPSRPTRLAPIRIDRSLITRICRERVSGGVDGCANEIDSDARRLRGAISRLRAITRTWTRLSWLMTRRLAGLSALTRLTARERLGARHRSSQRIDSDFLFTCVSRSRRIYLIRREALIDGRDISRFIVVLVAGNASSIETAHRVVIMPASSCQRRSRAR